MITHGGCHSYKREILDGVHQPWHVYRLALFGEHADIGPQTTSYKSARGEIDGVGYIKGGMHLPGFHTSTVNGTASLSFDTPIKWQNASIEAAGGLVYNASLPGLNSVSVLDFKGNFRSMNGPFIVHLENPLVSIS